MIIPRGYHVVRMSPAPVRLPPKPDSDSERSLAAALGVLAVWVGGVVTGFVLGAAFALAVFA